MTNNGIYIGNMLINPYIFGNPAETPTMIYDGLTATTVDLYWGEISSASYVLQKDGVTIYSGSNLHFQATGLSQNTTYSFRIKSVVAGFTDSNWETVSVHIPTFYSVAAISSANHASTSARQTSLESGSAGVDVAFSISFWVRISNITQGDHNGALVSVSDNTNNDQYAIFLANAGSQTSSDRLRFILTTNSSNLIYAQTQNIFPKNRWVHVVMTYDGTEVNSGLEIYLNGAIEASPTRVATGTYTGGLNSAANRFRIGHPSTTRDATANIADVCYWNKELNSTEVSELYNAGVKLAPSSVSFYGANIVAFYPLSSDVTCTNNASLNLTNSGVSFGSRTVDPTSNNISFRRSEVSSSRYVAFGSAFKNDTEVFWYGRSGTSHVLNGKIIKIPYTISTQTAGTPVDVITDGTYDLRGGSAGIIGSSIFNFLARYNGGTDTFIDTKRYVSTDGLTGSTFGTGISMTDNYTRFNFYGEVVTETIGATTYTVVPYYGHNGAGTWKLSVYYTTDAGSNWTKVDISDGANQYGEASLIYADGYWMLLARRNNTPFGIYETHSTDLTTWSTPTLTNLAGTGDAANCAMAKNSFGLIQVVVMDRTNDFVLISKNNRMSDLVADPTAFAATTQIFRGYSVDSYNILGYPNIVYLGESVGDDNYFISVSTEFSSSRADHFYAFGAINGSL
jgi:hypothetical protein